MKKDTTPENPDDPRNADPGRHPAQFPAHVPMAPGDPAASAPSRKKRRTPWRARPLWLRTTVIAAGAAVAAIVLAVGAVGGYDTQVAPRLAAKTASDCAAQFTTNAARSQCRAGETASAKKTEKAKLLQKKCAADYSDTTARIDCVAGDDSAAQADQKAADDAAAAAAAAEEKAEEAAEKEATRGQSVDNPYPAGAHATMESTNRIDGTEVDYEEWFTGFTTDWRGYDEFDAPHSGKKYVAYTVHVEATDAGVDASEVAYDATFTDSDGNVYEQADATYDADPQMPDVTLGAGQKASGVVVFEVPSSVSGGVATFGDGSVFEALKK